MRLVCVTPRGTEATTLRPGDELVIGLVRNAFWFLRARSPFGLTRNLIVDEARTSTRYMVPGEFGEGGMLFSDWIKEGRDPLDLIEQHHPGLLAMQKLRWEEANGLLRPMPRRLLFRALEVPSAQPRRGRSG